MRRLHIIIYFTLSSFIYSECSDLNYDECLYWAAYCEWNDETGQCQEIGGGGGGGDLELGPYDFETTSSSSL